MKLRNFMPLKNIIASVNPSSNPSEESKLQKNYEKSDLTLNDLPQCGGEYGDFKKDPGFNASMSELEDHNQTFSYTQYIKELEKLFVTQYIN